MVWYSYFITHKEACAETKQE